MMEIREEVCVFLTALVSGAVLRTAYYCIVCLRDIVRHKPVMTEAEDILYWLGGAFYLFVQIYHTSDGGIRWYFVLGVVIGAFLTSWISRKIKKVYKKIYTRHKKDFMGTS